MVRTSVSASLLFDFDCAKMLLKFKNNKIIKRERTPFLFTFQPNDIIRFTIL